MSRAVAGTVAEAVDRAIAALDVERLQREYWDQNEFLYIKEFLPRDLVDSVLVPDAHAVKTDLNRNYIPGHKKGGSVSYYTVIEKAPNSSRSIDRAPFGIFESAYEGHSAPVSGQRSPQLRLVLLHGGG